MVHFTQLNKKQKILGIILISSILLILIPILLLRFLPYPELDVFLKERQYSTRIFDCNHNLIQILPLENGLRREYTPLEDIPEEIIKAFIQAEDQHFYSHFGIDVGSVLRASFQNISNQSTISGASTITMQLARIISPSPTRNILAKGKEALNALRLELRLSKSQILELYLNNLPFGFNTEGVSTAARSFYGKNLKSLTQEEIYTLAVIPRRPQSYNPLTNPENCAERASQIFNIQKETLVKTTKNAKTYEYPFLMPHYIQFIIDNEEKNQIGIYKKEDVILSASLELQFLAEELLSKELEKYRDNRISNGAILVTDTQTGQILAWVGSGDFSNESAKGQIDGVLAENQPGSSMKPFLYALALEKGYSPATILPDIPLDFGFSELYIPQNFNNRFNGPIRFRIALASSLNVPAVYLLNQLGMETYLEKLRELHFESLENQTPGLGLALGNAEVSLFELVNAFSVFPKNGYYVPNNFLQNIDIETDVKLKATQVFSYDTSALICDILSDENSRALGFGYSEVFKPGFDAIFKTGTANQYQNITALGATPLYTVGVWMGNFDGETVLGKTGSSIPAAICKEILMYLQGTENVKFAPPNQWEKVEICSLSGKLPTKYCRQRIFEYSPISTGTEKEYCTWHTENGLVYPELYRNWLNLKNRNGEVFQEEEKLTILTPRNDSVFFFDPRALTKQKIKVEAIGGNSETIFGLLINTDTKQIEDFQEIKYPFDFYIPLSRGNFTLYLVEDYKKIETVLGNGLYVEQLLADDEKICFQVK